MKRHLLKQQQQVGHLSKFAFKTLVHKYYTNAASELTSMLAASALVATFVYIFYDFLHKQLSDTLPVIQQALALPMILTLAGLAFFWSHRTTRSLKLSGSCYRFAKFLGADTTALALYVRLAATTLTLTIHAGLYWLTINLMPASYQLHPTPSAVFLLTAGTALAINIWQHEVGRSGQDTPNEDGYRNHEDRSYTPMKARVASLVKWRLTYMTGGLVKATWLGVFAGFISLIAIIMTVQNLYLAGLASFVMGCFACLSLAFLLQRDLETSWIDKQIGMTHHDFTSCYLVLASLAGLGLCVAILISMTLLAVVPPPSDHVDLLHFQDSFKLCLVALTPCLLTPALMLQIDGRKPLTTTLTVVLPSMFIATGILMHAAVFILIPLGMVAGLKYQINRFYRA